MSHSEFYENGSDRIARIRYGDLTSTSILSEAQFSQRSTASFFLNSSLTSTTSGNSLHFLTRPERKAYPQGKLAILDRQPPRETYALELLPTIARERGIRIFNTSVNSTTSELCGMPIFCSNAALRFCSNTSLNDCEKCSMSGAGLFLVICLLLGLLIVLGNGLVIAVVIKNKMKEGFSKIKASLAIADAFTGVQLLGVVIYNFTRTITGTVSDLDARQLELRKSIYATVGGMLLLLTLTSSLYHLAFMSVQRFYAIKWPLKYRRQGNKCSTAVLVPVWILSFLSASAPGWLSTNTGFTYHHALFIYYPTPLQEDQPSNYYQTKLLMVLFYGLPLFTMSILSVLTAALAKWRMHQSEHLRESQAAGSTRRSKMLKKDVRTFVTVSCMQIGFTLTVVPLTIVNSLFFSGALDCSNAVLPFTISFYIFMSNGLVNVLIYSVRDINFRRSATKLFHQGITKTTRKNDTSSGTGTKTTRVIKFK